MKHNYLNVGNLKLHYVESGSGKLVILLHGFPDFWYSWRYQIPVLSKSYRVVAPDLRGYNKSDKPKGIENYTTSLLVQDISNLIEALGENKASIVGHDWGGFVAWNLAMTAPEKVSNLIIINCPHPVPLLQAFWSMRFQQLQKSWYVFFFQTPKVPEEILSRNNCQVLQRMLLGSFNNKKVLDEEDIQLYIEAWSQQGALAASINYYRANWNPANILSMPEDYQVGLIQRFPKIKCRTLVIWGEKDIALEKSLTVGLEEYIENTCQIKYFPNLGHWIHNEEPDAVNSIILSFLE
ncbi:MAG: alpha/beta fold hydrolase [Candidatus Hodarchaeota archaeon]